MSDGVELSAASSSDSPIGIAFDVMGSDLGLEPLVRGAARLSIESPGICPILVGDQELIQRVLKVTRHSGERIAVHHAPAFIGMAEPPAEALARKPDTSIDVAVRLVREGEAQAVVTAGNTGAAVLACARRFTLLPGVRRAALAAVYPTRGLHGRKQHPFALLLDVGATIEVSADDLVTFAVMGAHYARLISLNDSPKVALLSNGSEPTKGPSRVVEAHARLRAHPGLTFIGNIEGVDIAKGTADVVVCDGFVGNVCLKMLEGVQEAVLELAQYAYKERLLWRAGLSMLSSGIRRLKDVTDWAQYGGAPVLGFDRLLIKAHGRSGARAIANAGKVAHKAIAAGLAEAIQEGLAR